MACVCCNPEHVPADFLEPVGRCRCCNGGELLPWRFDLEAFEAGNEKAGDRWLVIARYLLKCGYGDPIIPPNDDPRPQRVAVYQLGVFVEHRDVEELR